MVVHPKLEHPDKTLIYGDCKRINSRYEVYMEDVTFIRFIPVIHAENPVHTLSFYCRLYPQTCVTSYCDVFEIDLNMQLSFLHAALLTASASVLILPLQQQSHSSPVTYSNPQA